DIKSGAGFFVKGTNNIVVNSSNDYEIKIIRDETSELSIVHSGYQTGTEAFVIQRDEEKIRTEIQLSARNENKSLVIIRNEEVETTTHFYNKKYY
ncbi:MAG: hypothetical protein ACRC0G_06515, partial [Fusobacteriaceae bacterium]